METRLRFAAVALCLLHFLVSVSCQEDLCPNVESKSDVKFFGRMGKISVDLTNYGTQTVRNAVVKFGLPPPYDIETKKTLAFPDGKTLKPVIQGSNVYWFNFRLAVKKGKKKSFTLKVRNHEGGK